MCKPVSAIKMNCGVSPGEEILLVIIKISYLCLFCVPVRAGPGIRKAQEGTA